MNNLQDEKIIRKAYKLLYPYSDVPMNIEFALKYIEIELNRLCQNKMKYLLIMFANGLDIEINNYDNETTICNKLLGIFRPNQDYFNNLTKDPLYIILTKSRPEDVLNLCQVNTRISVICQNDNIFRNLLELHFPNSFDSENKPYKKQYINLTNKINTEFLFTYRSGELIISRGNTTTNFAYSYFPSKYFIVKGDPIPGTKIWLGIKRTMKSILNIETFNKKEDAVNYTLNEYINSTEDAIKDIIMDDIYSGDDPMELLELNENWNNKDQLKIALSNGDVLTIPAYAYPDIDNYGYADEILPIEFLITEVFLP